MLKVEVEIFVGSIVSPVMGGWMKLPMENEKLTKSIEALKIKGCIISDYQTELPIEIEESKSPYELNEFLLQLKEYEEEELRLFLTAYLFRDENLQDTIKFLEKGNYRYYEDVENTEDLGEAVVHSGALGYVLTDEGKNFPHEVKQLKEENIMDVQAVFQYLDFEKIGNDYECNGCRIYPTLKTAIMEKREEA